MGLIHTADKLRDALRGTVRSPARQAVLVAAHAADTRWVLAQDAAVTAELLANLGPVIQALQPTKDAVLRTGALLIVKLDWALSVYQLSSADQLALDHEPHLLQSPTAIADVLRNLSDSREDCSRHRLLPGEGTA
jgi:hypothetical protein